MGTFIPTFAALIAAPYVANNATAKTSFASNLAITSSSLDSSKRVIAQKLCAA